MQTRADSVATRRSTVVSAMMLLVLLVLGSGLAGAMPHGHSVECDLSQCLSANQLSFAEMNCAQARQVHSCLRRLSCQGNLEYHTLLVLASKRKKQCSSEAPTAVRSGDSSNIHQTIQRPRPSTTSPFGRKIFEPLSDVALQYCFAAAYNYTISRPVISLQQYRLHQDRFFIPTNRIANRESFSSFYSTPLRRNRRSTDLKKVSRDALQLIRSHQERSTEGRSEGSPNLDMPQSDQPEAISNLVYVSNKPPMPMPTCIIWGDPHLRTFDSRYQTCNSIGSAPLIEHPLFAVQITNSRLNEQFNTTGVTKVTVQVQGFGPCQINSQLSYETDSRAQTQPSTTFNDGSVSAFGNMVYIKSSSQGQMVTIHLVHIGARVYITQFENTHFLNVVVKFRTSANEHSFDPLAIVNSISPLSMCRSGCHPRFNVDLRDALADAGVDTDFTKDDLEAEEIADIEEEALQEEASTPVVSKTPRKRLRHRNEDYDESSDLIEKPHRRRHRRDQHKVRKSDSHRRKQNQKKKKAHKVQKESILHPRSLPISPSMTRSSDDYEDPYDDDEEDEVYPAEKTAQEKCEDMREYYRLTCLYDVAVKGISNIDPHRFAISFDERRLQELDFSLDRIFFSTSSALSSSSPSSSFLATICATALTLISLLSTYL